MQHAIKAIDELEAALLKRAAERKARAKPAQSTAPPGFAWYDANASALAPIVLDQSPRAVMMRKVRRIAYRHTWGVGVIQRAMDDAGVSVETDLSEAHAAALLEEITMLDDRAQTVCDCDEAPPAR